MPRHANNRKPQVMDADERRSTLEKLLESLSSDGEPEPRQTSQQAQVIEGKFRESLQDQLRREHYEERLDEGVPLTPTRLSPRLMRTRPMIFSMKSAELSRTT